MRSSLTVRWPNRLEVYEDYPRTFDAWEITDYYKQKMWLCDDVSEVTPIENGYRVVRKYQSPRYGRISC